MPAPTPKRTFVDCPTKQAEIDAAIIAAYRSPKRGRGEIKRLTNRTGWTHHEIYKRALEIGALLTDARKNPNWTADEEQFLADNAWRASAGAIAKAMARAGFSRSPTAIKVKIVKMGLSKKEERTAAGFYSATNAGHVLGVSHQTIIRYIGLGLLPARRAQDRGDAAWQVTDADLRRLLRENVAAVDFTKIDKFWLAEQLRA